MIDNIINTYLNKGDFRGLVSKFSRSSNKNLLDSLKDRLLLLDIIIEDLKVSQLLYHYIHGLNDIPKCSHCLESKVNYKNLSIGYYKYCSNSCQASSIESKEKTKITNIEKYGSESYTKTEYYKKNLKQKHKEIKFGFNSEKYISAMIKKYGSDNPSNLEDIKEKKKITFYKNYDKNIIVIKDKLDLINRKKFFS